MQAFHNNPEVKSALLAKLASTEAASQIIPKTLTWDGETGSVVGFLTQGESLDAWEQQTGLPAWLALLVDTLAASVAIDAAGQPAPLSHAAVATALLAAVPLGAEPRHAGATLIQRLLQDGELRQFAAPGDAALSQTIEAVAALHAQTCSDSAPSPAQWRALRKAATAMVDQLKGRVDRQLGGSIEAACWDPALSATTVSDTLRSWFYAVDAQSEQACGWATADDELVRTRLDSLYKEAVKTVPAEDIDVFALYEAQYPEEAQRTQAFFASVKATRGQALLLVLKAAEQSLAGA